MINDNEMGYLKKPTPQDADSSQYYCPGCKEGRIDAVFDFSGNPECVACGAIMEVMGEETTYDDIDDGSPEEAAGLPELTDEQFDSEEDLWNFLTNKW